MVGVQHAPEQYKNRFILEKFGKLDNLIYLVSIFDIISLTKY